MARTGSPWVALDPTPLLKTPSLSLRALDISHHAPLLAANICSCPLGRGLSASGPS